MNKAKKVREEDLNSDKLNDSDYFEVFSKSKKVIRFYSISSHIREQQKTKPKTKRDRKY